VGGGASANVQICKSAAEVEAEVDTARQ
jgi:hypothetical protein